MHLQKPIQDTIMRNPKSLKEGFGLPEYVAYANLRQGLRPFLRADRYSIAVVRPPGSDSEAYKQAARFIAGALRFEQGRVVDFTAEKANAAVALAFEAMRRSKSIFLFADIDSIPHQIRASVDLLVELKPPTTTLMKGVFQWRDKVAITDKQAEIFLLLDDDMKRAIARPGRNVGRMLAQLVMRRRDQEPQPPPPAVEPGHDDFEYSLESMPGYGEAKDWGMQLSDDLADWKADRIPWRDVDTGLLLSGPSGVGKTIFAKALANTCDVELVVASAARWQSRGHGVWQHDENGNEIPLPEDAKTVLRLLSGKLLIVSQGSMWNHSDKTWAGMHAKMSASEIRTKIERSFSQD